ncbi:hypothetical protein TrCOL_g4223 [Triparma columacea]|uniref:Uncharacterized protein n=1 Tax=Triparma columacea TaxID=722753 RepID=A0A9W7G0X0_9STRA|nr:hypothetical protein TrCOL_g4223 [Triparma columacea]
MTLSQKRALKIRRNNDYLQKMGLGRGIIAGIDEGDEDNSDKEEVEKEEKVEEGKKRRILTEEEATRIFPERSSEISAISLLLSTSINFIVQGGGEGKTSILRALLRDGIWLDCKVGTVERVGTVVRGEGDESGFNVYGGPSFGWGGGDQPLSAGESDSDTSRGGKDNLEEDNEEEEEEEEGEEDEEEDEEDKIERCRVGGRQARGERVEAGEGGITKNLPFFNARNIVIDHYEDTQEVRHIVNRAASKGVRVVAVTRDCTAENMVGGEEWARVWFRDYSAKETKDILGRRRARVPECLMGVTVAAWICSRLRGTEDGGMFTARGKGRRKRARAGAEEEDKAATGRERGIPTERILSVYNVIGGERARTEKGAREGLRIAKGLGILEGGGGNNGGGKKGGGEERWRVRCDRKVVERWAKEIGVDMGAYLNG